MRRNTLIAAAGLLTLVLGAFLVYRYEFAGDGRGPLIASGIIESDETILAPEVSARIVALPVAEGDRVKEGNVIARLDDSLVQLQLSQLTGDPAQRQQTEIQAAKYVIHSPTNGVVTRLPVHVGEVVTPAEPIAAVADLSQLTVTAYIRERDLGRVRVGQEASVTADPFPGQAFTGTVTSINASAEFTPRNVQTQRDRDNLVFGVKVRVENAAERLRPGMPVDIAFATS